MGVQHLRGAALLILAVCVSAGLQAAQPQGGLWWNPSSPGHGYNLSRSGNNLSVVWYSYGTDGLPAWYLAAAPMNGNWSVSDAGFSMLSDPVPTQAGTDGLSSRMEALFEVFMGRPLTKTELQIIVQENTADYASMDEATRGNFDILIGILRTRRGTPMDFHVRKLLINNAFFDEDREALYRKLMLSVDPVVVVNTTQKEVMTQRDILAFVQILKFHDTGDDPREIEKSRNDKDNVLAAKLTVQLNDIAKEGSAFPEMLLHTSALWTGLVQYWPSLTDDQKKSVRFYIATSLNGTLVDMPDELYIKLMGWTEHETSIAAMHRKYRIIMMMQGLQNRMLGMQQLYNSWYYGLRD